MPTPWPKLRLKESVANPIYVGCDGKILTIANRSAISVWDLSSGKRTQQSRNQDWWLCALSPNGKTAAIHEVNKSTCIVDTATGEQVCQLCGSPGFYSQSNLSTFSPDGAIMATDYFDDKGYCIRFWDVATGKELPNLVVPNDAGCIALSHDRKMLAIGHGRNGAEVYDLTTRSKLRTVGVDRVPHPRDRGGVLSTGPNRGACVKSIAFSPDGKTLAVGDNDGNIDLYKLATYTKRQHFGGQARSVFDYSAPWVAQLMFSEDGKTLVSLDRFYGETSEPKIHLWEVETGGEICAFGLEQPKINAIALSPDAEKLASAAEDGSVFVWDLGIMVSGTGSGLARLSPPDLEYQLTELMGVDFLKARMAIWNLVACGDRAVEFLQERLSAPFPVPRISRWITDLDSDHFELRQEAMAKIRNLGELAEPDLRHALATKSSKEFCRRAEIILAEIEKARRTGAIISPARLRAVRCVEVLEHIGSAKARRLLDVLSGGEPGTDLAERSKEALERLAKRPPPTPDEGK
jgi:hypothetical protein